MGPENGRNEAEVSYFPISEYIDRIKVEDNVLFHMEETNRKFDNYFKALAKYDNYSILFFWLDSLQKEFKYSHKIENHFDTKSLVFDDDIFFDNFNVSHQRIKRIHQYITQDPEFKDYRNVEVRVSAFNDGVEDVFWRGANAREVKKFMDDFIAFYKTSSLSVIGNNPFLKSALAHLLFVRIHPFNDGNGRTARMIHNIKFTEAINNIYKANLRICPLNLSQSILLNRVTYAKRLNNIYFDLEHECNHEINCWFDFVLNMADEQIYYNEGRLPKLEETFKMISKMQDTDDSIYVEQARKMKIPESRSIL